MNDLYFAKSDTGKLPTSPIAIHVGVIGFTLSIIFINLNFASSEINMGYLKFSAFRDCEHIVIY